MCDYPTTRWPYVKGIPTKYLIGLKKTALEEVTVNGNTQLSNVTKGRTWVDSVGDPIMMTPQFDQFRGDLQYLMEWEIAGGYFGTGGRPQPYQFYGTDITNPERWNLSVRLSVVVGDISQGVEWMDYDYYNGYVRFGNEEWEFRNIYI